MSVKVSYLYLQIPRKLNPTIKEADSLEDVAQQQYIDFKNVTKNNMWKIRIKIDKK